MKSSKYHTKWLIVLLAFIVLVSGSASALTEDFTAFAGKKDLNVCSCDFKTDTLTVQNTGDITSNFMISTSGEADDWVDVAPQTFTLEPGEVKQVDQFVKVPCGKEGEFELNTTVKTLFDLEKSLQQTVKVQNCQNVQIIPKFSGIQTECPCTPVQYSFDVLNTGNHVETYEISVEPFSDAITLSTDFLILEPGEKQTVDVFINLECGQYGEKVFTFNALAKGTGILGQTDFMLDIQKCYDYDLIVGTEYGVCQGIPNIIPFTIDNKAQIANEFALDVQEADWAYPENASISAWGGEAVDSNIILIPPIEDEGQYTIGLESISARGEEQKLVEIMLETEKCYDYVLTPADGAFESAVCQSKDHKFTLTNIGSRETTYFIELDGFDWLTTTTEPIVLQPGGSVDLIVKGDTPCDAVPGEYAENIYVTMAETNQTYLEEKTFNIHTKEEAFLPEIEFDDMNIGFEGGETEVKIRNAGFETARYDFSLVASDWITLDTNSVELAPGEESTFMLQAYPTEDVLADTYAAELITKVADEGVEYSIGFLVDLKQDIGTPLWIIIAVAGGVLAVLIIGIIILVILTKKKKKPKKGEEADEDKKEEKKVVTIDKREYSKRKKEEKKTKLWPIILILAIAIVVAGGLYYAFTTGLIGGETGNTGGVAEENASEGAQTTAQETSVAEEPEDVSPDIVLTEEDIDESLITIDRSSVPGEGDVIEVTEDMAEIDLEMSIKNPTDRKATFEVASQADSWIQFEKSKLTVLPESTKTINVKITPDFRTLDNNDYSVDMDATLEGKKINYTESLSFTITKNKEMLKDLLAYWPWVIAGIVTLLAILLVIGLVSRKTEEKKEKKEKKEKPLKEKKSDKKEDKTKKQKGKKAIWPWILSGVVGLIIILALGFWAYNTFMPAADNTVEDVNLNLMEEAPAENMSVTEEKITEDDLNESLITIDRSSVPGEGNILKFELEEYILPLSIKNPTDRKARFQVSTENESWVSFDHYNIIVEPESSKTVDMTITPDMDALKESDYMITINTMLEGKKIDYEEELSFVVKDNNDFRLALWMYAVVGLVFLGLAILVVEIVKRKKKSPAGKKKSKTSRKKEKDIADINKELAALRKKTVLKINK